MEDITLQPMVKSVPYHIIPVTKLARYIINLTNRTQFCKIAVIGSQGTGKTNITVGICNEMNKLLNNDVVHIYARGQFIINTLIDDDLIDTIADIAKDRRYINFILDDFSYVVEMSKYGKMVKHNYTKLRHLYPNKKLSSFITMHYKKAIAPLLRDVYIRIFTHMNAETLRDFKEYKFVVYSKNFIRYINKYYIENKPFFMNAKIDSIPVVPSSFGQFYQVHDNKSRTKDKGDNSDIVTVDINLVTNSGILPLVLYREDERLALIDYGTDVSYLYYNILYGNDGLLRLDNLYVISNDKRRHEGFDIPVNNFIYIEDENRVTDMMEDEDEDDIEINTDTDNSFIDFNIELDDRRPRYKR